MDEDPSLNLQKTEDKGQVHSSHKDHASKNIHPLVKQINRIGDFHEQDDIEMVSSEVLPKKNQSDKKQGKYGQSLSQENNKYNLEIILEENEIDNSYAPPQKRKIDYVC